jgi:predicted patatin/cPLA2 family phospholipase
LSSTANSGVELVDAVTTSTAAPGLVHPVTLNGARYIDGGVRSLCCASRPGTTIYSVSSTKHDLARKTKERYPATTYSPTPLPGQYHRRWWA